MRYSKKELEEIEYCLNLELEKLVKHLATHTWRKPEQAVERLNVIESALEKVRKQ